MARYVIEMGRHIEVASSVKDAIKTAYRLSGPYEARIGVVEGKKVKDFGSVVAVRPLSSLIKGSAVKFFFKCDGYWDRFTEIRLAHADGSVGPKIDVSSKKIFDSPYAEYLTNMYILNERMTKEERQREGIREIFMRNSR